MTIGQLNVALGLLVNKQEWQQGEAYINHFRRIALTFGAVFGGRLLGKSLVGFNENVENAKNQIASMLAMTKQTSVSGELENANKLYDMLRAKAMQLPGETQDYVDMLALLTQPLTKAKMGLEDMRDITVGAFITSKAMGDSWQVAARDIGEFINFGKINKVDRYLRKILEPYGIDATKGGRAKAEAMGTEGRAALIKRAVTSPQEKQMEAQMSKSFTGRMDALKDTLRQVMGKAGEALFTTMKGSLTGITDWLAANQENIMHWASVVGTYIAAAFDGFRDGVNWLLDHQDVLAAFLVSLGGYFTFVALRAVVAWLAVAWPMFAGAGLFLMFATLFEKLGVLPTLLIAIGGAALLMWLGVLGPIALLMIGFALIAAAVYVFRDNIAEVFEWIGDKIDWLVDKAKYLWHALTDGPGEIMQQYADQQNAEYPNTTPMRFNPETFQMEAAGGQGVSVDAKTTVNIHTDDVAGAKAAFGKIDQDRSDAMFRAAKRNLQGNR